MDSKKFMQNFESLIVELDENDDVKKDLFGYMVAAFGIHKINCGFKPNEAQKERRKPVLCVESQSEFVSLFDASKWLKSNGWPNADRSVLSRAARGVNKKAYGFTWKYV